MRKLIIVGVVVAAVGTAAYFVVLRREAPAAAAGQSQAGNRSGGQGMAPGGRPGGGGMGGGMGMGGPGGGGGFRPPMTVELAKVSRGKISAHITVVGNLIGAATVDVAPKTGGRLQSVSVKLGDRVRRGQAIAKIEDREIVEQVNQAEASQQVAEASIRRSDADLSLALTNVERARNLFARQLLPKQQLDDAEARYTSAVAQLDLSRAQAAQSEARLKELRINLANTSVVSPSDGFVAQRNVDPGAWVSQNAPVVSVVDISSLRLVANVVEKDLKAVNAGDPAVVEVDAYPGEKFNGRIARVSPILDPATRTASMEIEIPNREFKLKPGMYAKVTLEVDSRENTLLVPKTALVDSEGQRGIYQPNDDNRAQFKRVSVGLEDNDKAEILEGLREGEMVISTGAGALRRNDQLLVAGGDGPSSGRRPGVQGAPGGRRGGPGAPGGEGRPNMGNRPGDGPGGQRGPGQVPSSQEPQQRRPQSSAREGQQRPVA
jgi:membrane fusion protein (multidrug efflux system)